MPTKFAFAFRSTAAAAALWAAGTSLAFPPTVYSQEAEKPKPAAAGLPLTDVVMFSSGVGFYQRNGAVEGDAQVDLQFDVDDVNDLLKSMVVQDLGGGKVTAVGYSSRDPISKTLRTFAVDLEANPTLADLLNQVRGERASVSTPNPIEGVIVGVEKKQVAVKDRTIEVEKLLLLTESGLRTIDLANAQEVRLLRPELQKELEQALAVLASVHDVDQKTVALQFRGKGKRDVSVGYINESPIWKTSYRLVIGDDGKPLIQGWAIVENTTEEDWKDVALTLVSGRPISFVMDLYTPLYVNRPTVEPELYASLRPQTYDQDMDGADKDFKAVARDRMEKAKESTVTAGLAAAAPAPPAPVLAERRAGARPGDPSANGRYMMDLQKQQESIASVAQAGDVGELFRYVIETPVSIARRQSAMLPIVNDSVEGEKLSIFNEGVHAKHPLNGLRLKNTTGLHLMQGPVTVFDDGTYAGDAKIEDLAPGTERLVSYAMDLDTEVAGETSGSPEQMLQIKIVKGTMYVDNKSRRTKKYTIKNSGKKAKTVLVEYPKETNWSLIAPKEPKETTRDRYRFAIQAEPGKAEILEVVEERTYTQTVVLTNLDDNSIRYYISRPIATPEVKKALEDLIRLKGELNAIVQAKQRAEQEISEIGSEQTRIRQNLPQLDRASDLFARYVKKFDEQESRIETLRTEVSKRQNEEAAKRKQVDDFLINLNLG
ncbi:MAG TPA: hypothetical protein VGE52_14305 [Pirellulales bacterium]